MWPYTPLCAPSPIRGWGITTLIKNKNVAIMNSKIIYDGHILFTTVKTNNTIFYLYNFLIPQNDKLALDSIQSFREHCAQLADDGVIVIGGDFNCTEDPVVDRLRMPIEHRPRVACALSDAVSALISGAVLTQKYKNSHGPEITPRPSLARPEPDSIVFTAHPIYYLLSTPLKSSPVLSLITLPFPFKLSSPLLAF